MSDHKLPNEQIGMEKPQQMLKGRGNEAGRPPPICFHSSTAATLNLKNAVEIQFNAENAENAVVRKAES